jgi:lipoprotein-anchoring transpeptidase ErfK/SrfK
MKLVHLAVTVGALALAGCTYDKTADPSLSSRDSEFMALIPNPAPDKQFQRYMVDNPTGESEGVVVVETKQRLLYYTMPNGMAMRAITAITIAFLVPRRSLGRLVVIGLARH